MTREELITYKFRLLEEQYEKSLKNDFNKQFFLTWVLNYFNNDKTSTI